MILGTLEKLPERSAAKGTLDTFSTPFRLRVPFRLTFQCEFFRLTLVLGIWMGPPRVMTRPLVAVAGLIGASPFEVGEARS